MVHPEHLRRARTQHVHGAHDHHDIGLTELRPWVEVIRLLFGGACLVNDLSTRQLETKHIHKSRDCQHDDDGVWKDDVYDKINIPKYLDRSNVRE